MDRWIKWWGDEKAEKNSSDLRRNIRIEDQPYQKVNNVRFRTGEEQCSLLWWIWMLRCYELDLGKGLRQVNKKIEKINSA